VNARTTILSAIRAAGVPAAPAAVLPPVSPTGESVDERRERFLRILAGVGGQGVVRPGVQPMEELLQAMLGDDRSNVIVVRGRFAVAENGAVFVDAADLRARSDIVRMERLVVIVPFDAIVPTMHDAVRLMPADSGCGWFLSGPSKTADIEQSLVFGAQGSREHIVVFDRADTP
jgi:hypothetical protein